jgi:histone deacetylase complex regulatory component SIN3
MERILEPYPALKEQFLRCISTETIMISSAVQYVNKIKIHFFQEPEKYEQFLVILKEFQRGNKSQEETTLEVEGLLQDSPELIQEFKQFYEKPALVPSQSQETLNESTPLLSHDVESQQPKKSVKHYVGFGILCTVLAAGIGSYVLLT